VSSSPLAPLVGLAVLLTTSPPLSARSLNADQAVLLALEHSPELTALDCKLQEDRAGVDAALRLRNPQLRISDLRSSRLIVEPYNSGWDAGTAFEDFEVGLRWAPPNLGSWSARRARAERRVDQTAASQRQQQRDLAARVRSQHAALLNLDRQLALATTAVELRDKLRGLIARRLKAQAATALDQSLSELDYLDAVADLEQLGSQRRERYHSFLALLGQAAEADFELSDEDSTPCRLPPDTLQELVARARVGQPRLEMMEARLAEVDAELSRADLELIPWFDYVELSYMIGQGDFLSASHSERNVDTLRLRMGINLPLLDQNQSEREVLRARRSRHQAEQEAALQRLALRVRRALDQLKGQVSLYQRYSEADRDWVDKSLAQIEQALEAGEADLVQLALVQSRTLRARRAWLRTHLRCQEAHIELERLVGSDGLELSRLAPTADAPRSQGSALSD